MKIIKLFFISCLIASCNHKKVKFSGLNDLVIGVQQLILYENGDFYFELGLGGIDGTYEISNDTIHLTYKERPKGFPDKVLLTNKYLITIADLQHKKSVKLKRSQ